MPSDRFNVGQDAQKTSRTTSLTRLSGQKAG
jgi:hypothetical protein